MRAEEAGVTCFLHEQRYCDRRPAVPLWWMPSTTCGAARAGAGGAEVLVAHLLDGSRRGFELTLRDLSLGRA